MDKLQYVLIAFVPLLFSLSFHEASHAWAANKLGDSTAKYMGRLSLNPMAHIDWFGTVILPILFYLIGAPVFGWAKPVPVNEGNLKHGNLGGLLVAAAGPMSNLLLAVIFSLILRLLSRTFGETVQEADFLSGFSLLLPITLMVQIAIQLNVFLAIFNLLPLPPLDGSRVAVGLFPSIEPQMAQIQRFSILILIFLFYTPVLNILVYAPAQMILRFLMTKVAGV